MTVAEPQSHQLDLAELSRNWAHLDSRYEDVKRADGQYRPGNVMTDRRFDEATETGRRLYIKCANLLAVARDHQLALEDMVKVAIRPCASWSLIRPAFEASFYVIWALEPDDAIERRRRGLRLAWNERTSWKNRRDAEFAVERLNDETRSAASKAYLKELKDEYEREARDLHMARELLGRRVNLVECLPKLESVKGGGLDGKYYTLVWRELSGLEHADMGASAEVSDVAKKLRIPGGWQGLTTVNDQAFSVLSQASMSMQLTALNLYITRTMQHSG